MTVATKPRVVSSGLTPTKMAWKVSPILRWEGEDLFFTCRLGDDEDDALHALLLEGLLPIRAARRTEDGPLGDHAGRGQEKPVRVWHLPENLRVPAEPQAVCEGMQGHSWLRGSKSSVA